MTGDRVRNCTYFASTLPRSIHSFEIVSLQETGEQLLREAASDSAAASIRSPFASMAALVFYLQVKSTYGALALLILHMLYGLIFSFKGLLLEFIGALSNYLIIKEATRTEQHSAA